jgi:acetyltransferase
MLSAMPPDLRIRRLKPADAARVQAFVRRLSAHARVERYFAPIRELSPRQLERITRAGDPRDIALAVLAGEDLVALAECAAGEFAVVVADAWQGLGVGEALVLALLAHAGEQGLPVLHGLVRERNRPMLRLARRCGFGIAREQEPGLVRVERALAHA